MLPFLFLIISSGLWKILFCFTPVVHCWFFFCFFFPWIKLSWTYIFMAILETGWTFWLKFISQEYQYNWKKTACLSLAWRHLVFWEWRPACIFSLSIWVYSLSIKNHVFYNTCTLLDLRFFLKKISRQNYWTTYWLF